MLYNVTFNLQDKSTCLIPHIPFTAADDEDKHTERVCFADSVSHCIEAIGSCSRDLYAGCMIVVRSVDESWLDKSKLIACDVLYSEGLVPDAMETHECWYLDEVEVKREVYQIHDFDFEHDIAFTCIQEEDMRYLAEKYVPDIYLKRCKTAEDIYKRTAELLHSEQRYEDYDEFDNQVLELPWAQKISISNLKMSCVSDFWKL